MKQIQIILALCAAWLCMPTAWAQTEETNPQTLNIFNEVQVVQDSAIIRMMEDRKAGAGEEVTMQGFRVQVYSSNKQQTAKVEAFKLEKDLLDAGLEMPIYVQYNPPFWKVRLGNFRTSEEAQAAKTSVLQLMPELKAYAFIVRDEIIVKK